MVGEHTYFEINPHGLSPKELDVRLQGKISCSWNLFKIVNEIPQLLKVHTVDGLMATGLVTRTRSVV